MLELWGTLVPILLADVLNPVLFAFMVYAAGMARPVLTSGGLLLGHTLAYLGAGFVVALGLEQVAERLANPRSIDFALGLAVGLLLIWAAWRTTRARPEAATRPRGELGPWMAIGLGAVVNFVGIPFALPYFAAVDQILKADLTPAGATAVLVGYNLLYALPFLVVPVLVVLLGARSRAVLERINRLLERASAWLMPVLLLVLGVALVVDAALYFVTGHGLY